MNYKYLAIASLALAIPAAAQAQSAVEALEFSQPDLKGTARFMSMGGAFGALGADLSSLSQNPAGIGVYRRSDIGFTLDLSNQYNTAESQGYKTDLKSSKLLLNNIGGVFTLKLNNSVMPNLNFGFTYNKTASFRRRYTGVVPQLGNSMTNYMAAVTNGNGEEQPWTEQEMTSSANFNPWFPNDGYDGAPWISILGYQSFLTTPIYSPNDVEKVNPRWIGQFGTGTTGTGFFHTEESGGVDSYNIALGGNISNVVFWGMDFDIINFNYNRFTNWNELLNNAYVEMEDGIRQTSSDWGLTNNYNASGSGFNYKLGVIVKPIQELRLGFAFHTPTWYNLTESYTAYTNYRYDGERNYQYVDANGGQVTTTDFSLRTPWKLVASVAGVIANRLILSFDYEWTGTTGMKFGNPSNYWGFGYDYGYDWDYDDPWGWDYPWYGSPAEQKGGKYITRAGYNSDPYYYPNQDIKTYCKATNTFRVGAEFRVTNDFSVRAGYAHFSSPVKAEVRDDEMTVYTSDVNPSYRLDNTTNYITAGLGWSHRHFYADAAYVYKHQSSTFHAFTPDPTAVKGAQSPQSSLGLNDHQVVLTMGVRF